MSRQQEKWGHSPSGVRALGGESHVREWDAATNEATLPDKKDSTMDHKPRKMWVRGDAHHEGAIKHPGALTEAAHEHGVSKLQEAERESHSEDKHIRGRGLLGIRLIKHTL